MPEDSYGRPSPSHWTTVRDPEQARLLTDPRALRYFEPFLARELSVSEAAAEVGCEVDTMLYRVRTFLAAGLLRVTGVRARAGRPIKHYRSAGDAYFVPFDVTPFASLEERMAEQMDDFNREVIRGVSSLLIQTGRHGQRIYRNEGGEVWNDSAADPETPFIVGNPELPVAFDFSQTIRLEEEDARALQVELHELFTLYSGKAAEKGRQYLWQIRLLPKAPQ